MRDPWFPLYVSDYLAKTCHLTQAQHGAYMLLMMHYYATGGPINANAMQVHAICRCTTDAERNAANTVLQLFFTREGDFYRHSRIDEELATRSALRTKRQSAAQDRWVKERMQVHMQVHTQSQSHIDTQLIEENLSNKKKESKTPSLEEVKAYCLERNNSVDPAKWFDFYQSKGWYVGKNKMRDWRAAVRTWERNNYGGEFRDGYSKTGRDERKQPGTQVQRAINNTRAILDAFPEMVGTSGPDSAGQKARPSVRNPPLLEAETGEV